MVNKGYIKGIIGLPPNLFYGTGIPACIIVLDKENAHTRQGIFILDASAGFLKDGNKNRLRDRDIHRIVDVFTRQLEVPKYARMVSREEIEKNDFNLNIPRYIDSQQEEDIQDIEAHLRGGIPNRDIAALEKYWEVCPNLKTTLFESVRENYSELKITASLLKQTIHSHTEFVAFKGSMEALFEEWRERSVVTLKALDKGCHPKQIIRDLSEDLLAHYTGKLVLP